MNKVRLGDLCTKITDGSHYSPQGQALGFPMYSVKDMTEFGFEARGAKLINDEDYKKLTAAGCKPEIGDVLIAKDGSVLKHVFVFNSLEDCAVLSSIAILRPDCSKVNPDYLSYSLKNPQLRTNVLDNYVSGSGVPRIVLKDFKEIEIPVLPLQEQNAVVKVLRSLDSKIQLNTQMSLNLEQIAHTIFKSWFVDFDPVHAKFRGEEPEGMDAETAALFPDSFEDSELGPIPAGWKLGVIGDLGRIITGKTPSTKKPQYWSDGTYPFITIPDLHESRFPVRTQRFVSQTGSSSQPTTKLPPYSVVVSCIATAGLIGLTTVESHTNQQINAVVVEEKENAFWVLNKLIALSPEIRNQSAIGTVFPNLSKSGFSEIRIVIPPLPLIEEYSESISSFVEMQIHLESESAKLAEIRDLLLPRLISGELEIPEELLGE